MKAQISAVAAFVFLLTTIVCAADKPTSRPTSRPTSQPAKPIRDVRELVKASGEPFPDVEVSKWTDLKLSAVNEKLAAQHGRPVVITVKVAAVSELKSEQNKRLGKYVLRSAREKASPDCSAEVQAYFTEEDAQRLGLADIIEGEVVRLSGVATKVKIEEYRGWVFVAGLRCEELTREKRSKSRGSR